MTDIVGTIAGLKAQYCPGGGWTGQPKEIEQPTVADCLKHGVCGCIYGDAVKLLEACPDDEIKRLQTELKEVQEAWYGRCVIIEERDKEIDRLHELLARASQPIPDRR